MNPRVFVLLLVVVVAVVGFVAVNSFGPSTPFAPTEAPGEMSPGDPASEPAEEDVGPPEGGILVLDRHDRPTSARILTADTEAGLYEGKGKLGEAGVDGRLTAGAFRDEPGALLFAVARTGVGGPVKWDPQGVTIRLSDGCVVTGTIRDGNGDPVPGSAVWPGDDDLIAFADAEGRYRIDRLWPGREYEVGLPWDRENQQVVTFERMGEEKRLDIVAATPPARGLLVSVRFEIPPRVEPHLSFDLGTKKPMRVPIPLRDSLIRCPVPLDAGQEVRLSAFCPGFATVEETVTMPETETLVRVTLDLVPGGLPLYGRVVDEAGDPVAGAEVRLCRSPALDSGSYRTLKVWSDGRFRLRVEPDRRHLIALSKGHGCSDWFHLGDDAREVVLVVTEACVVEGRVVDRDSGQSVPGVTVKLAFEMRGYSDWRTKSGDDGTYRFAGIPAETFVWPYVETTRRAEAVEKPPDEHWDPAARSRTDAVENGLAFRFENSGEVFRRDLPVVRNRGGTCWIVLVPPEGESLPETITVIHESRSPRWHRTHEWEAELDLAAPAVEVWMEEGTHSVRFRAGAFSGQVIGIEVTGDGSLPEREVRLGKQARVLARLVDRDGNRIRTKGVRVQLAQLVKSGGGHSGSGIGSATTDEAGEADVTTELPTADNLDREGVSIRFTLRNEAYFHASPFDAYVNLVVPGPELARRLRDAGGEDIVFDVPAWRYLRVPVVVRDAAGNPQAGVRLVCAPADEFEQTEVVSDARGVATAGFRFEPDSWKLDAVIEATGPWVGDVRKLNCDECLTRTKDGREVLVLTVSPCREVAVRIVDGEGQPLKNHPVRYQPWYPGLRMVTDASGVVTLRLPDKETEVTFEVEGYTTDWETVPAGALKHTYTARRNRFVEVELIVPDALSAEREFVVDPAPVGERLGLDRDAKGRFLGRCEVPTGAAVELTVISPDRRWEARVTVGAADTSARLVLARRQLYPVTLRIIDDRTKAAPEGLKAVTVWKDYCSHDAQVFVEGKLTVDGTGRVTVQLPAGEHEVEFRADGWEQVGRPGFTVPAKEEVVLRFMPRR